MSFRKQASNPHDYESDYITDDLLACEQQQEAMHASGGDASSASVDDSDVYLDIVETLGKVAAPRAVASDYVAPKDVRPRPSTTAMSAKTTTQSRTARDATAGDADGVLAAGLGAQRSPAMAAKNAHTPQRDDLRSMQATNTTSSGDDISGVHGGNTKGASASGAIKYPPELAGWLAVSVGGTQPAAMFWCHLLCGSYGSIFAFVEPGRRAAEHKTRLAAVVTVEIAAATLTVKHKDGVDTRSDTYTAESPSVARVWHVSLPM